MKVKQFFLASIPLLGLVAYPGATLAHLIETNYQLVADSLEIQPTFSTGEVFPNAPVVVYSPNDPTTPWLEGRTDEEGKFVFNPDPAISGEWAVEIGEESNSHWDRIEVPVSDRGIEFESISQADEQTPHSHRQFANQLIVAAIALGSIVGGKWVGRKVRRS